MFLDALFLADLFPFRRMRSMLIAGLHECIRQHVLATIKSRQLTQRALAELVGVGQAHISNFLLGRRGLSIEGMDALLNVLGLDVERLIAMSEQPRDQKVSSTTLESVPLIQHNAAMNPTFGTDEILVEMGFTKILLRRLKADSTDTRKPWIRFVAIRADAALAAPMYPRLSNGSVLLVDRHYCLLSGHQRAEPNLYMIRKEQTLMVRWIEMQGSNLSLRPDCGEHPLDFICIDRKHPLTSCIVGRVVYIATEI
jgi:transcriptional regulator with XRE-family HTH domain